MLKWMGFVLGALTLLWMVMQRGSLSWGSLTAGASLALALLTLLHLMKAEKPVGATEQNDENLAWQMKLEEAESRASQTIDGLNRELQKLQQKSIRSEERCLSYQKLVDVHQHEIEKLRQENQVIAEQLIQKERKLSQLQLARIEPDLFDSQRRQTESVNRELKKQLSEKQELLHETRSHLFQTQNELATGVIDLEQQLKASEEAREKLESELAALRQLMTGLSLSKDPRKTAKKKRLTEELESRDLLG